MLGIEDVPCGVFCAFLGANRPHLPQMQGLGQLIYAGLPSWRSALYLPVEGCDRRKPVASRRKHLATREMLSGRNRRTSIHDHRAIHGNRAADTSESTPSWRSPSSAAIAAAIWQAPSANWDLALLGILLGFSIFSDVMSIETESRIKVSGNFLALGPGDGLPRRHAGGADRGHLDRRRLAALQGKVATTSSSTC